MARVIFGTKKFQFRAYDNCWVLFVYIVMYISDDLWNNIWYFSIGILTCWLFISFSTFGPLENTWNMRCGFLIPHLRLILSALWMILYSSVSSSETISYLTCLHWRFVRYVDWYQIQHSWTLFFLFLSFSFDLAMHISVCISRVVCI